MSEVSDKEMDKYEVERCADTLIKAEEIKSDSKKMKAVAVELKKRKKAIESVPVKSMEELKDRAYEVSMKDDEEEEKEEKSEEE